MEAPLYQLEKISQVAVSMYTGSDDFCEPDEAWFYAQKIPTLANFYTLEEADHFAYIFYTGDDYVDLLKAELTEENPEFYNKATVQIEYEGFGDWCEDDDGEFYYCGGVQRGAIIAISVGVAAVAISVALFFILRN